MNKFHPPRNKGLGTTLRTRSFSVLRASALGRRFPRVRISGFFPRGKVFRCSRPYRFVCVAPIPFLLRGSVLRCRQYRMKICASTLTCRFAARIRAYSGRPRTAPVLKPRPRLLPASLKRDNRSTAFRRETRRVRLRKRDRKSPRSIRRANPVEPVIYRFDPGRRSVAGGDLFETTGCPTVSGPVLTRTSPGRGDFCIRSRDGRGERRPGNKFHVRFVAVRVRRGPYCSRYYANSGFRETKRNRGNARARARE